MSVIQPFRRLIPARFLRENDGAITVEAVLWVPVYLVFFALITDVSMMFHGYSKALRIAQDTNRHASTGFLKSAQDTATQEETKLEALAKANLDLFAPTATVTTILDTADTTPHVITNISIPSSDLQVIGLFSVFANINIQVSSVHLLEV